MSTALHPAHSEPMGIAQVAAPLRHGSAAWRDFLAICIGLAAFGAIAVRIELAERLSAFVRPRERFQLDELMIVVFLAALAMAWFAWRRMQEARSALQRRLLVEERLARALAENRRYAMDSVQRQEAQSRQLARELHDELGQMLYAIKLDAVAAARTRQMEQAHAHVGAIGAHVDQLQRVVRTMLQRLRPVGLDELGLAAALEACVQGWRLRLPHVRLTLRVDDGLDGLDEATNITLYRLIQESLTNCARHAQATRIDIGIVAWVPPGAAAGNGLLLSVQDDGVGCAGSARSDGRRPDGHAPVPVAPAGFGLLGMRERVEALSGTFTTSSSRGRGFRVEARLPGTARGGGNDRIVATATAGQTETC